MNRVALFAAATIAMTLPAFALDQEGFERIAARVFEPVMAEYDIPGIAVGVVRDGEIFVFTAGVANAKTGTPVTRETLFELGSVSKLFTVTLAAQAERDGLLSLDDPVGEHIPDLDGAAFGDLTLADLATHSTGGMPLHVPEGVTSRAQLNAWLAKWKPAAPPATTRSYSNLSIGLLGAIVADRLGTSYAEAMEGGLFPALGLTDTFVRVPEERMDDYAMGTNRDGRPTRMNPGFLVEEAYGVRSTVVDMTRFLAAQLGTASIDPGLAAALARTRTAYADTAHYAQAMIWEGYAWPVDRAALEAGNSLDMALKPQPITPRTPPAEPEGAMFWNKTGSTSGFGTYVALLPGEKIGVVVLANRGYPNPVRAAATMELIEALIAAD
ncbi:MAG TPA: class C beta-lactamase [Bauldia sp.]|nr:class C beta-lactamase [Bauldia sp.]